MRSPCSKIDRVCIHIIVWKNTLGVGKSGQARGHGTNQWFMNTVLLSQIAEALHCFLLDIAKLVFVFAYDSTTNTGVLLFASSLYIWMQVQLLPYFPTMMEVHRLLCCLDCLLSSPMRTPKSPGFRAHQQAKLDRAAFGKETLAGGSWIC